MVPSQRPNVLLITTDQQRHDSLGCTSGGVWQTPNLDRLASEGMLFEKAYTTLPVCVPARTSVMTGQYASVHGLRHNAGFSPERWTFIKSLRAVGYQTAALGKMHFFPMYADHGMDHMVLCEHDPEQGCFGPDGDDYQKMLRSKGLRDWQEECQNPALFHESPEVYQRNLQAYPSHLDPDDYSTGWVGRITEEFLSQARSDVPWFAWVSFLRPHHPFSPPSPYDSIYRPKAVPLPSVEGWKRERLPKSVNERLESELFPGTYTPEELPKEVLRRVIAYYHGAIRQIDDVVGRILDRVDLDRTLVVFTSDHGEYLGHRGRIFKNPNEAYDDLSRVPLIVRWPSRRGAGKTVRGAVSLVDLAPTILALANLESPLEIQGTDLSVYARNAEHSADRIIMIESHQKDSWKAACDGRWKYIRRDDGSRELYDLTNDPEEFYNLIPPDQPEGAYDGEIRRFEDGIARLSTPA